MHPYLYTPQELAVQIAQRFKDQRLHFNFSQQSLSDRSGVSLAVIKKFEQTGKIALESMLKLSVILDLAGLFIMPEKSLTKDFVTIAQLAKHRDRKRGRK